MNAGTRKLKRAFRKLRLKGEERSLKRWAAEAMPELASQWRERKRRGKR